MEVFNAEIPSQKGFYLISFIDCFSFSRTDDHKQMDLLYQRCITSPVHIKKESAATLSGSGYSMQFLMLLYACVGLCTPLVRPTLTKN
jgi:hypothetical protein